MDETKKSQSADELKPQPDFKPDWSLEPHEELAVVLSMVMSRHIPGWPGATDKQLEAAAKDIIAADKRWKR